MQKLTALLGIGAIKTEVARGPICAQVRAHMLVGAGPIIGILVAVERSSNGTTRGICHESGCDYQMSRYSSAGSSTMAVRLVRHSPQVGWGLRAVPEVAQMVSRVCDML